MTDKEFDELLEARIKQMDDDICKATFTALFIALGLGAIALICAGIYQLIGIYS